MAGEVNAGAEGVGAATEACESGAAVSELALPAEAETFGERAGLRAQESAEAVNEAVITHNLERYGEMMSPERRAALEGYDASEKITVCSPEAYNAAYSSGAADDFRVMGHSEADGTIVIKDMDPAMTRHTAAHETIHLCAEKPVEPRESAVARRSGLFECETRLNERGEPVSFVESDRGVNEGFTELYALRELEAQGDMSAYNSMTSYFEARQHAERVEVLLGREMTAQAYFGENKESLVLAFDRMCGETGAWERYAKDIDAITYSADENAVREANLRVNEMYRDMLRYRETGGQRRHDEL